jgi:hypothetical protein
VRSQLYNVVASQPAILPEKGCAPISHFRSHSHWEKKSHSTLLGGNWKEAQGLEVSIFLSQSHLTRSVQFSTWRLTIPRPPNSLDLVTLGRATSQWPPFTSILPFQKYPWRILSTTSMNHGGRSSAMALVYDSGRDHKLYMDNSSSPCHKVRSQPREEISKPIYKKLQLCSFKLVNGQQ